MCTRNFSNGLPGTLYVPSISGSEALLVAAEAGGVAMVRVARVARHRVDE